LRISSWPTLLSQLLHKLMRVEPQLAQEIGEGGAVGHDVAHALPREDRHMVERLEVSLDVEAALLGLADEELPVGHVIVIEELADGEGRHVAPGNLIGMATSTCHCRTCARPGHHAEVGS